MVGHDWPQPGQPIDRGAKCPTDWARLGKLREACVDIRFVHDGLDLYCRLGADLQAVIPADSARHLWEERRKESAARVRKELRPAPAPCGHRDNGRGKAKTSDPARAAIGREAFALYSTGVWTLEGPRLRFATR